MLFHMIYYIVLHLPHVEGTEWARKLVHNVNTLTSGLIQAVCKNTVGSHVALRGNIFAPVSVTDLVEVSKDTASLDVCTRKIFFGWGCGYLWVTS